MGRDLNHARGARRFSVRLALAVSVPLLLISSLPGAASAADPRLRFSPFVARSLDGSGSNATHPDWGQAGTPYLRVGRANYADGRGAMAAGPNARYVSNRVFNDSGQNLFSERGESQWGWTWGQFLDHDLGLRDETPGESAVIGFDAKDPLESYTNDFGGLDFARTPAAPGTGRTNVRQQINTLSSVIDASNVYGGTAQRLEWLRSGPVDSNLTNNSALLKLPGGYLPTVGARGSAATAPPMDLMGQLAGAPSRAVVAGDVRANENLGLTAVQTLFAREHNRIVSQLPAGLSDQTKFDIARRLVGAEVQYITYTEFLPSLGVRLPAYRGYDSNVDPAVGNEFATVGFRAHSMVHGEFDVDFAAGDYTAAQLDAWSSDGIKVTNTPTEHSMLIPLTVAFGNPDLLRVVGLKNVLDALGAERQYKNDEQIDNTLRSVLFEVPKPGTTDPTACQTPVVDSRCFSGVADLGADDLQRGRDHGMPSYNDMRRAYGLPRVTSFSELTGETQLSPRRPVGTTLLNSLRGLDFVQLRDAQGSLIDPASPEAQEDAVSGVRRTRLAARLQAIYGTVDAVDAFVGMVSEPHVPGTEMGALQLAMWTKQFAATRDGDRFFYVNDPVLRRIERSFGLTYRHSLAELIALDSGGTPQADVFTVAGP